MADISDLEREVQIQRYYPNVLANAEEFKKLAEIENPEFKTLWAAACKWFLNTFVYDADASGIMRWEEMLNITPKETQTLEDRRTAILIKINTLLPYTIRRLKQILDIKYGEDNAVPSTTKEYELLIDFNVNTYLNIKQMRTLLRAIIPANLIFKVIISWSMTQDINHVMNIIQYINSGQNFWNIGAAIAPHWDGKFNWDGEIDWSGAKGDDNWRENQTFIVEIIAKTNCVEVFSVKHEADILFKIKQDLAVQAAHENSVFQHEDARHVFWNLGAAKHTFWDGKFDWNGEINWSGRKGDERYKDRQSLVLDVSAFEKSTGEFLNVWHSTETTSSHALKQKMPISHADDITYSTGAKQTYKNSALANIRGSTGFSGLFLETGHNAEATSGHEPKQEIPAGHNLNYIYYTDSGVLQEASHGFIETASEAAAQKCAGTVKNLFDGSFCLDGAHAFEKSYTVGDAQTENLCVFYYIDKDKNIKEGSFERL